MRRKNKKLDSASKREGRRVSTDRRNRITEGRTPAQTKDESQTPK